MKPKSTSLKETSLSEVINKQVRHMGDLRLITVSSIINSIFYIELIIP